MDTIDSVRLELEAERHCHRKDNEYLVAENERLREALERISGLYDKNNLAGIIAREALNSDSTLEAGPMTSPTKPIVRCYKCGRVVDNFFLGMCPDQKCPSGLNA